MSGDMRRAIGHVETSPSLGSLPDGYIPASPAVVRKLANGRQSPTSPLKLFGHAKKKINAIFVDIETYIEEGNAFVHGTKALRRLF